MADDSFHKKSSACRFADIGHLPKRMLSPIEGYGNLPIVSLEEAVEPLMNIVPKVKRNVYVVKKNCQKPADNLTIDESASIMLYTFESIPHEDSLYVKLNATLRSEERKKLVPWFLYLRLLFTALARLPSESRAVFRGVRERLWVEYPKGTTFIWWAFSSCTISVEVLQNEQFLGTYGDRTLFQIECTSAKNIKKHSFIPSEDELLLLPARQLEVVSLLDSGNGLYIVQLKEVKSPFELLELVQVPIVSANQEKSSHIVPHISPNARWKQNGVTVAGGNGQGDAINQLNCAWGLFVDDEQIVFIADTFNHRIVRWKKGDTNGKVIAGGNGKGNRLNQLDHPTDVLIDKETNSLIIADQKNRRVIRWSRSKAAKEGEILIDNIKCWGLAMDDQRYLYVSDYKKHEIRRYRLGDKSGTLVTGGSTEASSFNQLNKPTSLFVDRQHNLYASDNHNHRVIKWNENTKGVVVAGGNGEGNALTQLHWPNGIFVDTLSTLYVTDWANNRVMRWCQGDKQGTVIVGGNGRGTAANQFNGPVGLFFDRYGNLYVADEYNHRVQRFDIE